MQRRTVHTPVFQLATFPLYGFSTKCRCKRQKNIRIFQLKNITSNSIYKNSQSFFACSMVNCDGSFSNLRNVETWTCNASAHSFCVFFRMSRVAFGVRCFIQKTSCYIITHFNYMGYKNYSQPQLVEFFLHDDFRLKF